MRYEDFELQIQTDPAGQYRISVRSPAGETGGRLVLPATPGELRERFSGLSSAGTEPGGAVDDSLAQRHLISEGNSGTTPNRPEALGTELFEALFGGRVAALFHESLARVGSAAGLRIKIRLDLADPRLVEIAALPWEYLYSEQLGGFLAIRRRTPIVRYVEVPRPAGPRPLPETLRILVLASCPRGLPPLGLAAERESIERSWGNLENVEVSFVERPTREGLGNLLRDAARADRPHHALHFMGHGRTDPATGEGQLLLATADGAPVAIRGEELARELADFPELRFVFLNACETAATGGSGVDPFTGVAAALVRTGVQAVVAMQRPISDRAAIELSEVLYRRIAVGDPLDTAITEGRLALDRQRETASEWATPVLFLRLPDGHLFEPRAPAKRPWWRRPVAAATLAALLAASALLAALTVELDPCAENPPEEVVSLAEAAERSVDARRYDDAARHLRRALEIDPQYAGAHSALGFVEMERGRYAAARESLTRAARELPECAVHAFNLGSFHLLREEYEQAAQSLRRALDLDPNMTAASAALGRTLFLLGGLESAKDVLEEGLRRAEGRDVSSADSVSSLHANLGRVAVARDEPRRAIGHLERARDLLPPDDPRRLELLPTLASARAAAGQTAAACRDLEVFRRLPRDPLTPWERHGTDLLRELGCPPPDPGASSQPSPSKS